VWLSIVLECGILFAIVAALYVVSRFVTIPEPPQLFINIALALAPLALWIVFSWWRERFVPQPRQNLAGVVIIAALSANAVGLPVINDVFQLERWLSLESAIYRIIGYTFTMGIVQSTIVYLVVRYTAWPSNF